MTYTYSQYLNYGVVLPLMFALLLLIGAVVWSIFLLKRKKHIAIAAIPLVVLLCAYILLIFILYPALPFLEALPFEKNERAVYDIVLVEATERSALLPIYYNREQNGFVLAGVVKTNRGAFYCINSNSLRSGDYVQITFLPYSRAVLQHKSVTEAEAMKYWTENPDVSNAPFSMEYRENGYEGAIIMTVVFLLTVKVAVIEAFATPLSVWLLKRDVRRDGVIRPRAFGVLEKAYTELVFLLACFFALWTRTTVVAVFLLLVVLGYGYYIAEIFSTRVTFFVDKVCFKSFSSAFVLKKQDIATFRWEYPRRSSIKVLKIYTNRKETVRLPLIDFLGLRAFEEWCKTGDGLREP